MTFKVLTQSIFIALAAMHSGVLGQPDSDPTIGETFFTGNDSIASLRALGNNISTSEIVPTLEHQFYWMLDQEQSPCQFFPVHDQLQRWRARNALVSFVLAENNRRLPLIVNEGSSFLLARWHGDSPPHLPAEIVLEERGKFMDRPTENHVALIWTPRGFRLNFYRVLFLGARLRPAVFQETIPLEVHSESAGLVLVEKSKGVVVWNVELTKNDTAKLAANLIN